MKIADMEKTLDELDAIVERQLADVTLDGLLAICATNQRHQKVAKNTMKAANRFKKGSGVFQCESCKRSTRDTGGDNTDLRLCEECYEIGGIENQISDQGSTPELLAEVEKLWAQCIAKGGQR